MPLEPLATLAASADRQALIPMAAGYLILMPALALGLHRLYRSPATPPSEGQPAWQLAGTVFGGYLLLLAVVVAYYYGVARVGPGFLESAATGNALLIAITAPVFAAVSWLAGRPQLWHGHPAVPGELLTGGEASRVRHPLIGYLAWAVLFGALFAWEGIALARVTGVPALSDVVRVIMRYPAGRWALFALWLWAGWRVFIRSLLHS